VAPGARLAQTPFGSAHDRSRQQGPSVTPHLVHSMTPAMEVQVVPGSVQRARGSPLGVAQQGWPCLPQLQFPAWHMP